LRPGCDVRPPFYIYKSEIINWVIKRFGFKKYLEIGVFKGENFKSIEAQSKIGIDPDLNSFATHHITSDDYLKLADKKKETFDIILIDGLHESKQVYRDIIHSLRLLDKGGVIFCHDMNPWSEAVQTVPRITGLWTGDCWKAFVRLRRERDDLEMMVIDTDCGIGVIRKGVQNKIKIRGRLSWKNLNANRVEWLNLVSVEKFKEIFKASAEKI